MAFSYSTDLLSYGWLKENGFHRLDPQDRQLTDHYRRCLGRDLIGHGHLQSDEDICLDVCADRTVDPRFWYVWLVRASNQNSHPSVWIHTRHMVFVGELVMLYEALTGREFSPKRAYSKSEMKDPLFPVTDPFRR